ncbi:MAG: hypothetical protein RIR70_82, partial [Pseudomonadota bacterium]
MTEPKAYQLVLGGMHCAACAGRIERAITALPGVAVSVNFALSVATVNLGASSASIEQVIEAVSRVGYTATLAAEDAQKLARQAREREIASLFRGFVTAAFLTLPLVVGMLLGLHHHIPLPVQWLLATPVQFYSGARFYRGAWQSLRGGGANMDVL